MLEAIKCLKSWLKIANQEAYISEELIILIQGDVEHDKDMHMGCADQGSKNKSNAVGCTMGSCVGIAQLGKTTI
jgi:hypothetical protein